MSTYAIDKYKEALETIANASDQANPIQLRAVAQTALDWEPTTADEFNVVGAEPYPEYDEEKKKYIYEKDMKELEEEAESAWRNTVLHPDYKSGDDDEE